jgi:hypothetical protein
MGRNSPGTTMAEQPIPRPGSTKTPATSKLIYLLNACRRLQKTLDSFIGRQAGAKISLLGD